MEKILVVDDDFALLQLIKNALAKEYAVTLQSDVTALNAQEINKHDLLILDVMMPEIDGFTFLREKRREIDIPVVFLTAKTFEKDLIEGLASGGDDYITKPFSINELRSRVMAHLRREDREKNHIIRLGDIYCDLIEKNFFVNETRVDLTHAEYEVCSLLAKNRRRVFSKEEIYENLYGYEGIGDAETTIRVRVKDIRKKFRTFDVEPIKTVWGVGYQWERNQ